MSITLSDQDKSILRTAAYGAVSLMAATGTPHKAATNASTALTSATGLVGHVLAAKSKNIELNGKTVAALADQVLPALTAAVSLLEKQDPAEADNFRNTVLLAVEAAAQPHQGRPNPVTAEMARKITAALEAARAATSDSGTAPVAAAGHDRPELQQAQRSSIPVSPGLRCACTTSGASGSAAPG